ncbi:MAG: 3-deoxy-manno-octulosonate cytidylyltransferase [Gammaproteobacteria bacterium]|nr:3-deoxy-manno-octulosonate cytidylyltransferase [Gammaproteobacteria bacterium]
MSFKVVIPARLASARLPNKVLSDIGGKPMVQLTYEQALQSGAEEVIVACDSHAVEIACAKFGASALMTREDHQSGTSRLCEVADAMGWSDDQIVVNVQADEPMIDPVLIDQVANNLANAPWAVISTLAKPLPVVEADNPNRVKVVFGDQGRAIYFSRHPVPYARDGSPAYWQHIGLYAYRVGLLRRFITWPPAPSERHESLEQLRVLHYGEAIHVAAADAEAGPGVDTADDLSAIRALIGAAS